MPILDGLVFQQQPQLCNYTSPAYDHWCMGMSFIALLDFMCDAKRSDLPVLSMCFSWRFEVNVSASVVWVKVQPTYNQLVPI